MLGLASRVEAQASPRQARVLALTTESAGVLVRSQRVFAPDLGAAPLSACAGHRCAPVISVRDCTVPECPGSGHLLELEHAIADVGDFPTDRQHFEQEVAALRSDPGLASIAWIFGQHPETASSSYGAPVATEPLAWMSLSRREHYGWEIGALASGAVLASSGIGLAGGEASVGFRYTWVPRHSDDEIFALLVGDVLGADLRAHALASFPSQAPVGWDVLIGIAPALAYATTHDTFRLPTFYGVLLPELGLALREGFDPTWYAAWSVPVDLLVDEHLGLEARATALLVDDWIPGDDVEVQVTLGLGVVVR